MRVELCAWKDALNLMKTSPNIHKYELAEEIGISEHMAEEFRLLFRELFPQEPKEIMSKKEINARYYNKNKIRYKNY